MTRRPVEAAVLVAAFGLLAGCAGSSEEREYAVPSTLCGVSVDPELVSPFLPGGKGLRVKEERPVPSRTICRLDVAGKWALMANLQWWDEDVSIATVADANPQLGTAHTSSDSTFFYSGTGAVVRVNGCSSSEHSGQTLYTSLRVRDTELADPAAMKKLATAYTEAVKNSDACS
ncbi:hypothetical protein [Streptomyces sp. NPDC047024]|uniref:hypothetical protein n=1 Tax=Streptomyces sp. NPDC047024 TaxID=3155476 RepID=UPI0034098744